MANLTATIIHKALCNNQGSLDFRSLTEQILEYVTVEEETLRAILFDDGKIAIQEGKEEAVGGILSPDSIIVAKTALRLCSVKTCGGCEKLHLCKFYVCGDCTFKEKCKNSHSVTSPHNRMVLGRCGYADLSEKQLFRLLLQNDSFLLPVICSHYNKGTGESGSCAFSSNCTKLHMCKHFLQGDCAFGSTCKRAHTLDAQAVKMFKQYSRENITALFEIYRNSLIILNQTARPAAEKFRPAPLPAPLPTPRPRTTKPHSPANPVLPKAPRNSDPNEICLHFVRKQCRYNEKCVHVHWHLPYKWEMWDGQSMAWKNMDKMEEIEKAFCNPVNDTNAEAAPSPSGLFRYLTFQSYSAPAAQCVDFMKMMYGSVPVRRLSTGSSVSHPPHHILTTEWLWSWKDDSGAWVEYGKSGTEGASASVSPETLEKLYLADREAESEFTAGNHRYKLSLKGGDGLQMYQQNMRYHTKREVRRRPRFVSALDVEVKLKSPAPHRTLSASSGDAVPANWDKSALPEIGYKLVPLTSSSSEYNMVTKLFKSTLPQRQVVSIQRIQNPSLWEVFQWQKEQMKKRNDGKPVNEKHLFHGTDKPLIDPICDQNFDWRMCGVHGTAYGKGSYFAKDASYSDGYAKGHHSKVMFVALVLVGEYARGHSNYVRPPPKGNGTTLYDSCVNSKSDPSIFVIFEKQQIYPEYLIEYK